MNSFKDLEELEEQETPDLPLGIKSNVQGQITGMRTMGEIVEVYLSKFFSIVSAVFGGELDGERNTHLITLFLPVKPEELEKSTFLENLTNVFTLSKAPILLVAIAVKDGTEISLKMPAKDAAKIKASANKELLTDLNLELR